MVHIHVERTIAAAPDRVFDWLADPANLTTARLMLKAGWRADAPGPRLGAVREAVGVGMWLREEITAYDRPHSYSYLIVKVFPPMDHRDGRMTFTPSGTGTHVDWETTYSHPALAGGRFAEALTSRVLRQGFEQILAGCAKALET
jgi:uncharacterized protein YndB with AHSA1/START domain